MRQKAKRQDESPNGPPSPQDRQLTAAEIASYEHWIERQIQKVVSRQEDWFDRAMEWRVPPPGDDSIRETTRLLESGSADFKAMLEDSRNRTPSPAGYSQKERIVIICLLINRFGRTEGLRGADVLDWLKERRPFPFKRQTTYRWLHKMSDFGILTSRPMPGGKEVFYTFSGVVVIPDEVMNWVSGPRLSDRELVDVFSARLKTALQIMEERGIKNPELEIEERISRG